MFYRNVIRVQGFSFAALFDLRRFGFDFLYFLIAYKILTIVFLLLLCFFSLSLLNDLRSIFICSAPLIF